MRVVEILMGGSLSVLVGCVCEWTDGGSSDGWMIDGWKEQRINRSFEEGMDRWMKRIMDEKNYG